jgi:putative nucleotidyltransferase with HDIG domain
MGSIIKQRKIGKRTLPSPKEDSLFLRVLLFSILVFVLGAFIHFRETRYDTLDVGKVAAKYVVAQIDFEFPDPDATLILRQEALRDIGRIYRIDEKEIRRVRHKFENYLIHHPNWRQGNQITFEEMYNTLDAVAETLISANLTDSRTFKKRIEMELSTDNYFVVAHLDTDRLNTLTDQFWDQLSTKIINKYNFNEAAIAFVIDYFKGSKWKVTNDVEAQGVFKRLIEQEIPEKYTRIRSGSRIIDQGEKITPKHLSMLNAMKKAIRESSAIWSWRSILGSLFFSLIMVLTGTIYFYYRERQFFQSLRQLSLYTTIFILSLFLSKGCELVLLYAGNEWIEYVTFPVLVPFATILFCVLLSAEIALMSTFALSIILGFTLAFDHSYFIFINMITGTITIVIAGNLKKRKEVFHIAAKIWVVAAVMIAAFDLSNGTLINTSFLLDLFSSACNLLLIALLIVGIMPLLETIFNVMTDMALMEFMDPTNELLKRLSIEAPGTYQHSLSIGHISEYVANAIGANGLFCRVTTLYHDIGKLNTPHYYTENQLLAGSKPFNIHQLLTAVESAYIIKSHIPDGVSLAKQHRLPEPFIDVIQQHHGTTLIKYFYIKHLEELGGRLEDIDENAFRYPGPKPQTKEAAIIMLSDSTEAASRSLEDTDESTIREMVDKIVSDKINDGQFDNCPLTFKELFIIKSKLVEIVKATHHLRIKYPKEMPKPL